MKDWSIYSDNSVFQSYNSKFNPVFLNKVDRCEMIVIIDNAFGRNVEFKKPRAV